MTIASIVAVAKNNVIGKDNKLIWKLPADMKYFKDMTEGCVVITGRKNYESIPEKFRPLPNRINIVITRQKDYAAFGAFVVGSITEAINLAKKVVFKDKRIFIIGGAEIYKQTMDIIDELFVTEIHHEFEGDAFFPEIDKKKWKECVRVSNKVDEKNKYDYDYCAYEKIKELETV
jgi:dihydrofolate reductase